MGGLRIVAKGVSRTHTAIAWPCGIAFDFPTLATETRKHCTLPLCPSPDPYELPCYCDLHAIPVEAIYLVLIENSGNLGAIPAQFDAFAQE